MSDKEIQVADAVLLLWQLRCSQDIVSALIVDRQCETSVFGSELDALEFIHCSCALV